jgi:hypothetical protein
MYADGCSKFVFFGGFYEGQGGETGTPVGYYQIKGANGSKLFTLIGASFSGNGIDGIANPIRLHGDGTIVGDDVVTNLHALTVTDENTVGLRRTAALGYLVSFNSTVPTVTDQVLVFKTSTDGFDRLAEYNDATGIFDFLLPNSSISLADERVYRASVDLELSSASAIPATAVVELRFGGAGYTGPTVIKARGNGTTTLRLHGTALIRIDGVSSAYMQFSMYHDHSADIVVANANGDASGSWFSVDRVN